jgi:hypothetical protein
MVLMKIEYGSPEPGPERGTGRTAWQMAHAPWGAIFVSCNELCVRGDEDTAMRIGRGDLNIMSPRDAFAFEGSRWRGREITGFIVDHAFKPLPGSRDDLDHRSVMAWIKTRIR